MKKKKRFLNMDERNRNIAFRVIAIMYFLTILSLQGIAIYRQFVLGQDISDFEDVAIVLTVNSLFLIAALLYFGAIPLQKIKIRTILAGYGLILVLGSIFIYLKYNVFLKDGLSLSALFDKFIIVAAVSGLLVLFWVLLSVMGKRRLEKELED